jgi:hypothetical protein
VGSAHVRGCAILSLKTITILKNLLDPLRNFVRADVSWEGEKISSISVYAPTDDAEWERFFSETLQKHLSKHPPLKKLFLAGDFNFVECPLLDRSYQNNRGTVGCQQWHKLFQDLAISSCDLFRNFHSGKKSYTFYSASHKLHYCLDWCFASSPAMLLANDCKHVPLPSSISDHSSGVCFSLRAINSFLRGPSYWKLYVSLMEKPGFDKIIRSIIADFKSSKNAYQNINVWWEMLKVAIQIEVKRFGKKQAVHRKRTILTTESQILQENEQLSRAPDDTSLMNRKVRLDLLLADYYDDICEAARVKAGLKHHVDGERPSKYFLALLKQRASSSVITSLNCSRNGVSVSLTEIGDILEEASSFYATLYSEKLLSV